VFVAPGVALQLTRLLKNRGLLPEVSASVTKLMLLGEVNTRAYRDRLGQWWGAEVYDASYGSTETGTLAAACPGGNQHLLPATNYFEVVTEQGVRPLGTPEAGRLVVTPLNLHARPLLRFDTGDEVALGGDCACGNPMPTVSVQGRASERLRVRDVPLSVRSVEELVFGVSGATGYLIEADDRGTFARLLLERDVEWNRLDEGAMSESVQHASWQHLGLRWDDVAFVNTLPANTKSGGSLKNWKRSNVRRVEAPA
jgi:phenylacetate-CoA ligase